MKKRRDNRREDEQREDEQREDEQRENKAGVFFFRNRLVVRRGVIPFRASSNAAFNRAAMQQPIAYLPIFRAKDIMGSNYSLAADLSDTKRIAFDYKYIQDLVAFRSNGPQKFDSTRANRKYLLIIVDAYCDGSGDFAWLRYIYDIMASEYQWPIDNIRVTMNMDPGCTEFDKDAAQNAQKDARANWLAGRYDKFVLRSDINKLADILGWFWNFHIAMNATNSAENVRVSDDAMFAECAAHSEQLRDILRDPSQQIYRENDEDCANNAELRNIPIELSRMWTGMSNMIAISKMGLRATAIHFSRIGSICADVHPLRDIAGRLTGNPDDTFIIFSTMYEAYMPAAIPGAITFHEGALVRDGDDYYPFTSYFGSRRSLGLCYPAQYDEIITSQRAETVDFLASKVGEFADRIRANGYFAVYSRRGDIRAKYEAIIQGADYLQMPRENLPVIVLIGSAPLRDVATDEKQLAITTCARLTPFEFNKVLFHSAEPLLLTGDLTTQHATAMGKLWISDGTQHKVLAFLMFVQHLEKMTRTERPLNLMYFIEGSYMDTTGYERFSRHLSQMRDKMPRADFYRAHRGWFDFASNLKSYVSKFNFNPREKPGLYLGGFTMFSALSGNICIAIICIIIILIIVQTCLHSRDWLAEKNEFSETYK